MKKSSYINIFRQVNRAIRKNERNVGLDTETDDASESNSEDDTQNIPSQLNSSSRSIDSNSVHSFHESVQEICDDLQDAVLRDVQPDIVDVVDIFGDGVDADLSVDYDQPEEDTYYGGSSSESEDEEPKGI